MTRRWYIAGPMSGLPDYNFPAFDAAAARLRGLGYEVVNPAEINATPPGAVVDAQAHWRACMRADIAQLVTCDGIALLAGWERSRGARIEHGLAVSLGMVVMAETALEQGP